MASFAVLLNGPKRLGAGLAVAFLLAAGGGQEALAATSHVRQLAGELQICTVPNPTRPASAFRISRSPTDANGDQWVAYVCKEACANWRQCQVPAYTRGGDAVMRGDIPKQALAFVVDGMGGHLAFAAGPSGSKTVLLHTGVGGVNYMQSLASQIESSANANVVMVRWENGFSRWGWFTRTSAPATRVPHLTRRVASMIAWAHENLAGAGDFGTVGCSMGTQATLGAVYWHDVDPVVDYQLMVGGPPLWDVNSGCGRRTYAAGYCDLDATRACRSDADCAALDARSQCTLPRPIALARLYEQMANHVHATQACDVSAADGSTGIYPPFDESGFAFVEGDWDFDHPIDFQMDIWGPAGDSRWGMGDAMQVFNSITSRAGYEKRWHTTTDSGHCAAIGNGRALELVTAGMDLADDAPPVALAANGDRAELALPSLFTATGSPLSFAATSDSPDLVAARVDDGALVLDANADGTAGTAVVTVTATDTAGQSASIRLRVVVEFAPPSLLRTWRLEWLRE